LETHKKKRVDDTVSNPTSRLDKKKTHNINIMISRKASAYFKRENRFAVE